jgi:hypothetical protein
VPPFEGEKGKQQDAQSDDGAVRRGVLVLLQLAFIEERGPYIQTVSDFLTRAEAGPPPG